MSAAVWLLWRGRLRGQADSSCSGPSPSLDCLMRSNKGESWTEKKGNCNISKHVFSEYISKLCYLTCLSTNNFRQNEILYSILKFLLANFNIVCTHTKIGKCMTLNIPPTLNRYVLAFDFFWNIHLHTHTQWDVLRIKPKFKYRIHLCFKYALCSWTEVTSSIFWLNLFDYDISHEVASCLDVTSFELGAGK